jgi:hypothetical protein
VRYTIWSGGLLIGATDLAFTCPMEGARGGWFRPNADGRRLMPMIASVLPAIRAYLECDPGAGRDAAEPPELPELPGSPQLADLREAFHRVASLELELRDASGARVPTASIGIQDTHVLLELAREILARPAASDVDGPGHEPPDDAHVDSDDELGPEAGVPWRDADDDVDQCWFDPAPDDAGGEADRQDRYQVFLTLADRNSLP